MISDKALREFKKIYKEQFGEYLDDEKAIPLAMHLLTMMNTVYRPIKKSGDDEYRQKVLKIKDVFKLPGGTENSIHGINHWRRVREIGDRLAKQYKDADYYVINYFAYIHDVKRQDDGDDPEHGARAAKYALELYKDGWRELSEEQMKKLMYACQFHSQSDAKSDDITIQICWDADRLDLWRLGIAPDPVMLYTNEARKKETIDFTKELFDNWGEKKKVYEFKSAD